MCGGCTCGLENPPYNPSLEEQVQQYYDIAHAALERVEALEKALKSDDSTCCTCIHILSPHYDFPCNECLYYDKWDFDIKKYIKKG